MRKILMLPFGWDSIAGPFSIETSLSFEHVRPKRIEAWKDKCISLPYLHLSSFFITFKIIHAVSDGVGVLYFYVPMPDSSLGRNERMVGLAGGWGDYFF